MTIQNLIEMLQQHDGNLPVQFYINKMPLHNVDVSIDYQLEQFVAFSLVQCYDELIASSS
jgi:hypothetical protein